MPKPRKREPLLHLIREAQRRTPSPNSSKAVCHILLSSMREAVLADEEVHNAVLGEGLNGLIRRVLKKGGDEDETGVTTHQLDMFPPGLRGLVAKIDRARVYVPSLGEYVPLDPMALTPEQMHEAGEHLIGKGRETIDRGKLITDLAAQMQADAA